MYGCDVDLGGTALSVADPQQKGLNPVRGG